MSWSAKVVEIDASKTVVRTLVNCNIGDVPLNPLNPRGQESVTITIPKYETNDHRGNAVGQYADIYLGRHIQVFEGTTLRFEGVPMKARAASKPGSIEIDVVDQGWYFTKAAIDAPVRNLLVNGNFEAGTTGWTAVGCTMEATSSRVRRGSSALKLTGTSTFAEQYIYQQVAVTGTAVGTKLTAAAHFNIDTWTGPAFESRGLFLEEIAAGNVEKTHNSTEGVIDDDTALGLDEWQRTEATTWVPPVQPWTTEVRFYVGNAVIYVDELELVEPTSLAIAPGAGEDIATTMNRIVQFFQNPAYGKSNKRIGTTTPPTTGKKFYFPKSWQYAEHTFVDTAFDEIVSYGVDYSIECATGGSTFTVHDGQMGSDLSGSVLLMFPGNVASYGYESDHDQVETSVTILGEGDGPDREEGYASDALDANGLVLQGGDSAPPGTTIDKLDDLAAARLALKKRPVRTLTLRTKGTVAVDNGDTVSVDIDDGVVQITGAWRVTRGARVVKSNGCLDLTLEETATSLVYSGGVASTSFTLAIDGGDAYGSASVISGGKAA